MELLLFHLSISHRLHFFAPVVNTIETSGPIGQDGKSQEQPMFFLYFELLQRLSVTIRRCNTVSILGTMKKLNDCGIRLLT